MQRTQPQALRQHAVATSDDEFKQIAANSDGIILMNYDEHQVTATQAPSPARSGSSATSPRPKGRSHKKNYLRHRQLRLRLDALRSACAGPRVTRKSPSSASRQQEDFPRLRGVAGASDAAADLDLNYDALNPHFELHGRRRKPAPRRLVSRWRHGASMRLRAARELGLQTFALWRLGEEDSSMWSVWTSHQP